MVLGPSGHKPADLTFRCAIRDEEGKVTHLANPGQRPVERATVLAWLRDPRWRVFAEASDGSRVEVHIYKDEWLRTDADETEADNLDVLPACPE